ncbi:hypothetical protein ABHF33_01125 [Chitinibacter sp. FCG-7]|uniref:Uncharacterized protein n=1 Tax=Chitinibacter mangrovi TaxID=3153927 RepID=A0AAU7FAU1_9NEIS
MPNSEPYRIHAAWLGFAYLCPLSISQQFAADGDTKSPNLPHHLLQLTLNQQHLAKLQSLKASSIAPLDIKTNSLAQNEIYGTAFANSALLHHRSSTY